MNINPVVASFITRWQSVVAFSSSTDDLMVQPYLSLINFTGIFADIDAVSTGDSAVDGMYKSPSSSSVFSFGEELIYMKNSSKLT